MAAGIFIFLSICLFLADVALLTVQLYTVNHYIWVASPTQVFMIFLFAFSVGMFLASLAIAIIEDL